MRRQPSLRSQLNQIRMWVRQGRTDAWIAHKLDVSVDELARFKREHSLEEGGDGNRARPADPLSVPAPEPASEELLADEEEEEEEEADEEERRPERPRRRRSRRSRPRRPVAAGEGEEDGEEALLAVEDPDEEEPEPRDLDRDRGEAAEPDEAARRRRRRGRRGGRRHRARRNAYEATFDHGGEGYGLWLDPAVADNPVYAEHWAGHRAVTVTVEAETITIRRAGTAGEAGSEPVDDAGEREEDR